jgi:protein-tyrosine-phosphatase
MAEIILKQKLKNIKNLKEKIEVYSAGIFAQDGDSPMLNVVETMKELRNRYKNI